MGARNTITTEGNSEENAIPETGKASKSKYDATPVYRILATHNREGVMNQVTVIGFLGSDPELKYLPSGTAVCEFSIADNRRYRNTDNQIVENVQWFRIHAFGKVGENANEYLAKGRQVAVFGRLESDAYESRDGKQIHASLDVYANTVQYLSSGTESDKSGDDAGDDKPDSKPDAKPGRRSNRK